MDVANGLRTLEARGQQVRCREQGVAMNDV
jgi:hypothetical protein